jgi:unsaturated rhamnogalacturonyl hydrolase
MSRIGHDALAFASALVARKRPADFAWRYEDGLALLALDATALARGRSEYALFVDEALAALVDAEGSIAGYRIDDFNLDQVCPGRLLFARAARLGGTRWRRAIETLREQLRLQPRTGSGAFWHKARYPMQVWLDGLYMAAPFLLRYGREYDDPASIEEGIFQLVHAERVTRDASTGLLRHGWDESRAQPWSDPESGRSPSFWSRAMGWYAMALVDGIEVLREGRKQPGELEDILERLMGALSAVADPETGLLWQVTDRPAEAGNYLEASASAMYIYALAKGARIGAFGPNEARRFRLQALRARDHFLDRFVLEASDGMPSIGGICSVAGLGRGSEQGTYRDGSPAYYTSEAVVVDDFKGLGPWILACLEMEGLA